MKRTLEKLFGSAALGFAVVFIVLLVLYFVAKKALENYAQNSASAKLNAAQTAARARLNAAVAAGKDPSSSEFDEDFKILGGTAKSGDAYSTDQFTRNIDYGT